MHPIFAFSFGMSLACLATTISYAQDLHAGVESVFKGDRLGAIVKATSAVAMVEACAPGVDFVPEYRASLDLLLKENDDRFGPGTSKQDIAKKVARRKAENDCDLLAKAHRNGFYPNIFIRVMVN